MAQKSDRRNRPSRWTASTLLLVLLASAGAATAGTLTNYNLFVFDNFNGTNSDVEGALAVGGNATLNAYSVGLQVPRTDLSLVVGGDLSASRLTAWGGVIVGGTLTTHSFTSNFTEPAGTPLPLDFPAEEQRLTALSALIATLPARGTVSLSFNTLTLTAAGTGINVFYITQAQLDAATTVRINAPASATVLINIDSSTANFSFKGMSLSSGITELHVLYNFYYATSLTTSGIGFLGSILAPNADYAFDSGVILGDVVVKSVNTPAVGEFNHYAFTGDLPVATPEPATWTLLAPGLFGLGLWIRRRRRVVLPAPSES